jgi:recombination protein RecT
MGNEQKQAVAITEKSLADTVQNRIKGLVDQGRLNIPQDYSVGNAISSAWLILQRTVDKAKQPVLQVCTQASVANALLDMAILGLSPSKDQGYFIAYGKELTWFTSYFGYQAAVSRLKLSEGLPVANVIYDGDNVTLGENDSGEEAILEHERSWANKVKGVIVGAYADIKYDGKTRSAVMTMQEIKEAWSKSPTDKNHEQFTGEFAKRTVINRLLKGILKTSTDQDLLAETLIKTEQDHFDFGNGKVIESVKQEAIEETGSKDIPEDAKEPEMEEVPIVDPTPPAPEKQPTLFNQGPVNAKQQEATNIDPQKAAFEEAKKRPF